MLIWCYVSILKNTDTVRGGVFLFVVSKNDIHRCWYKWFESIQTAGREAHVMDLARQDFVASSNRRSIVVKYQVFPESAMDTEVLDREWASGIPSGMTMH